MHFVLILAICIGLGADAFFVGPPVPLVDQGGRLAAAAFGVGFVILFGMVIATVVREQLVTRFDRRQQIMATYQKLQWVHTTVSLVVYAIVIYRVEWPLLVRGNWGLAGWVVVDELAILAPFLVSLVGSWFSFYRVDRIMRVGLNALLLKGPRVWTQHEYLSFQCRHYLALILVPVLCFFAASDCLRLYLPTELAENELVNLVCLAGVGLLLLVLSPLLIRLAWRAGPLPAGPLRTRLEALARRSGFRFSDILVWETGGGIVNAAVTGAFGRLRYVLLSDGMCETLSDEEIEAVFGHEIGHVRHHHMLFYFFFVLGGVIVMGFATHLTGWLLTEVVDMDPWVVEQDVLGGLPFTVAMVSLYFGLVFGFLSRRFERQADLFGCRVLADRPGEGGISAAAIQTFTGALEKVAYLNGVSRNLRSWRHFSIARRVAFLEALAENPDIEGRFQHSLR
jgi:STE24 endopeptidase